MFAFGDREVLVTKYIRNLRGGSQPILAQASDGLLYIVKFSNNLQGANLLFNESAGSELYRACGLAGPSWKPLLVTDTFIDQNQACWMQTAEGRLRPACGLCFGSRFLGGDGIRLLEILPGPKLKRVRNFKSFWLAWLIDICAAHADNRQAIFLEDNAGWLSAFFVDHGHLFGGPKGDQRLNFKASRYLDPRIYRSVSSRQLLSIQKRAEDLDVDRLWRRIHTLPDEWKTEPALEGLAECFCRLSTPNLLRNILETMMDAQQQANEREDSKHPIEREQPISVLCPGVHAKATGQCIVA
ncbi:MAG: hypothetical protein ABSE51_19870 [Terracidiphilus sp.]|jgi:hypothetical protein